VALASRLGAAGVTRGKQVIAYDAQDGMNAARLWWMAALARPRRGGGARRGLAEVGPGRSACNASVPQPAAAAFAVSVRGGWVDAGYVLSHLESQTC